MSEIIERRWMPAKGIKLEKRDGLSADYVGSVSGYAARFRVMSVNLGGFREKLERDCFSPCLSDQWLNGDEDIKELFNHNPDLLLARTQGGSLQLSQDGEGLYHRGDLIGTNPGKDCEMNVRTGRVSQMSFAFSVRVDGEIWSTEGSENIRTVRQAYRLYDVSPVTYPAYPQTDISARSLSNVISLDVTQLLNSIVRVERKLSATKDDAALIRAASENLIKLLRAVEEPALAASDDPELRALSNLRERISTLKAS